ncbi:sperm surface protein Sp17-like [Ptychodera flava]|uniref:sperm surface protein Sp17-like n=1 Tax=Ptychodera flava TaxID=63121 RepID=UPI003969F9FB
MSSAEEQGHHGLPEYFVTLLDCLTTEILFQQPDDIYKFCAEYTGALQEIRKATGKNPLEFLTSMPEDAERAVSSISSNVRQTQVPTDTPLTEVSTAIVDSSPRRLVDSQMTEMTYDIYSESEYSDETVSNYSRV